jgi:hypothetical protein
MKEKTDTARAGDEQLLPPVRSDQEPTAAEQLLRLSAALAERELGEALERWEDEGGAFS